MLRRFAENLSGQILWNICGLALAGLAVGCLIGLSVSEVIAKTVETVLGVGMTAVAVLAGLSASMEKNDAKDEPGPNAPAKEPTPGTPSPQLIESEVITGKASHRRTPKVEVNVLPLAAFTIFLTVGAGVGVLLRTHHAFGVTPADFAQEWQGTGIEKAELTRDLFKTYYPSMEIPDASTDPSLIVQKWSQLTNLPSQQVALRVFENLYPVPELQSLRDDPQTILKKWSRSSSPPDPALIKQLLATAYPGSPGSSGGKNKSDTTPNPPKSGSEASTRDPNQPVLYKVEVGACKDYSAHYRDRPGLEFLERYAPQRWAQQIAGACLKTDGDSMSTCIKEKVVQECHL